MSANPLSFRHPQFWEAGTGPNQLKWRCVACKDGIWRDHRNIVRHETAETHQQYIQDLLSTMPSTSGSGSMASTSSESSDVHSNVRGALAEVLQAMHYSQAASAPLPSSPPSHAMELDYDVIASSLDNPAPPADPIVGLTLTLQDWLENGPDTAPSDESSDDGASFAREIDPDDEDDFSTGAHRTRSNFATREAEADPHWYPWSDKTTCVLDVLRHLPRSIFSDEQIRVILWGMEVLGVNWLPSVDVMKDVDRLLQSYCGIDTIRYQGTLGNVYYANNLGRIIAQEIANPLISKHLHYYPEDSGQRLEQAWQAQRWLHEIDPTLATPMIRVGNQDYYVFEPTRLHDGTVVVPERWFIRKTNGQDVYYASAWLTQCVVDESGSRGYVILEYEKREVSMHELLLSMPHLAQICLSDNVPDPCRILGIVKALGCGICPWTLTDPVKGNRYRELAKGHRVASFMMWLYCDDTSGNVSKKWNKHNSFLFTAAGLPRSMGQQETNIHFLSTSNIAPPLEMLDGIVSQLELYQETGIWAWDVEAREMVLVIPVVLAMLGDNPMQSEIACHIGLKGKFFCRNCWVKGSDAADREKPSAQHGDDASGGDSDTSAQSHRSVGKKTRQKHKESLQEMVDRAERFLGVNASRNKDETLHHLNSMFGDAVAPGGKTHYGKAKTRTGLKDNFLEYFTERIFSFRSQQKGSATVKASAVTDFIRRSIPKEPFSPIWRIKGLDPHQDTPVEILHVILLGFVKYLWRDVISRLSPDQKSLLVTRINSFDTSGLGFSPLAGQTLVQYAGSLTGRDFRAISQVAPFVLYDLVPNECYETWLALSAMVPLIWQPVIVNLNQHLNDLERAIDYFLSCTARWTPRWFNKPKFHLLLHLLAHIRRFGPAILFATEGFESFNAVVRDHSVHSNRLAPSRDIGRGMARCNRIRHLLSGGSFVPNSFNTDTQSTSNLQPPLYNNNGQQWRTAAPHPLALCKPGVTRRNVLADYLGFYRPVNEKEPGITGAIVASNKSWLSTEAGKHLPTTFPPTPRKAFNLLRSVIGINGDICVIHSFILTQDPDHPNGVPIIGRIAEILQLISSSAAQQGKADYVLIEEFVTAGSVPHYRLPSLRSVRWRLIDAKAITCTVNVQHNCAAHHCDDKGIRIVYQEREATSHSRPSIRHFSPDDFILNTAQMRDAVHVQRFRIQAQPLQRQSAIYEGATREFDAQKAKERTDSESVATGTGRKRKQPDSSEAVAARRRVSANPNIPSSSSPLTR